MQSRLSQDTWCRITWLHATFAQQSCSMHPSLLLLYRLALKMLHTILCPILGWLYCVVTLFTFYRCTASSPGVAPFLSAAPNELWDCWAWCPWSCGNFIRSLPIKPSAPFFFSLSQRHLRTRQTGVNLPIHIDLMGCWSIRGFSTSVYGQWAHFHLFSFAGYIPSFLGSNIKAVEWLPQNDLLAHKDIKAFVSHVRHNSLYESAYHGVPVVAFPLFVDQFFNARKVEHFGLGVSVNHSSFDTEQLVEKIEHVINEPRYC